MKVRRTLLGALFLAILALPTAARSQKILAEVGWHAPVLSAPELSLGFSYGGWTSLTHEEVRDEFPATHAGGTPVEWGIRSREGLIVTFEFARSWGEAQVHPDPEILDPPELQALAEGGAPVVVSQFRYREDDVEIHQLFNCFSLCTGYSHGLIVLEDPVLTPNPAWKATVTVEFYCVYALPDGTETGTLASADVGLSTDTATFFSPYVPVSARESSWGTLKATFGTTR